MTLRHKLLRFAKDRVGRSRLRRAVVGATCGFRRALGIQEHAKQIVICGYPRSGTSLLLNMMSSSLDGFEFAPSERAARTMLLKARNCASKMPNDVFCVDELVRLNIRRKRLYIIIVIRDLRDVLTSIHANAPDRYYCNFDSRWTPGIADRLRPALTDNGIRRIHDAITRAELVEMDQPLLSTTRVRYEDIVTQCRKVQENLATFLGVTFAKRFSDFHLHPNKHALTYVNPLERFTCSREQGRRLDSIRQVAANSSIAIAFETNS